LATRQDTFELLHGVKVADPYRWLEDIKRADTKAWLSGFDGYTRKHLATIGGRTALKKRLDELSYIEWISAPERRGKRYFFSRRHKDKEKVVHYWRAGKKGEPRVLIDPNTLSDDGSITLKGVYPSYDGKWVAYKLSANNADEATLHLMDVATGKKSAIDTIEGAKYASASWEPNGKGFYYTRLPTDASIPKDERPGHAAIYYHRLGSDPKGDKLIHPKTGDAKTFIHGELSRDGHFLFVYIFYGWSHNDIFYKDLRKHKEWQKLAVGERAQFSVEAHKEHFYVRSNKGASRSRMFKIAPSKGVAFDQWKEIIAEKPNSVLRSFALVGDHLALKYLENASSKAVIADLNGKVVRTIALPGIGTLSSLMGNPEDDEAYYSYSSFTTPPTVYETSVKKGGSKVFFEVKVPVDPSPYEVEQVWYPSKDGTKVSMFIVRRKDMKKDGNNAMLLTGYGGFRIVKAPVFKATLYAWLERGGSYAMPNLRGGGEYGDAWHRAGMLGNKQNVFDDFIAAAEWLVAKRYTRPDRLAIMGGSNGGLLVGAAMVQRPELFGAVVCAVPLLDMLRYHKFDSGRTWVGEYGSADNPEQFKYLHAYSPYHNVREGVAYPSMLMLTADSDDRVAPMHARKFTAAIRHGMNNDATILVRVETKSGHGGGDMVNKRVARLTDIYSYLANELGLAAGNK